MLDTLSVLYSVQCMPEEGPTGPKRLHKVMKLCALDDLTVRLRILSYNVTTQSLVERSAVRDSDYHELKCCNEFPQELIKTETSSCRWI